MEAESWSALPDKLRANCVYNYNVPPVPILPGQIMRLSLFLGDPVVILAKSNSWFYGHTLANEAHKGVFPKNFVNLATNDKQEPLVEEINSSLKEWNDIIKQKYLIDEMKEVVIIQGIMRAVRDLRSALATGKLTEEEAKETRQKVVIKIDILNERLGLDLVVRNQSGSVLAPDKTSAVSLYRHHIKTASEVGKFANIGRSDLRDEIPVTNYFSIMVQIEKFSSLKVQDTSVDLIFSIYEVSEGRPGPPKPLCESYVIEGWRKDSKMENNRVLFEGISKYDIAEKKKLFLICNVVTHGNYSKYLNNVSSQEALENIFFRKPVGVAAEDITNLFSFKKTAGHKGQEKELQCPFLLGSETETLETTFRKWMEKKGSFEQNALTGQISILLGDSGSNIEQTHNYGGRIPVAKKLGLPEIIWPQDVRNDLYVNIGFGELSKLDKLQDRNVELKMEVCDDSGQIVKNAISLGQGFEPGNCFKSVVYRHEGKPRWNEVVKISLPAEQFAKCHLRFSFTHRSRRDEKIPPWAMSFLKLVNDLDETALKDQTYELMVYKIEKRVEIENSNFYLQMPFTKQTGSALKSSKNSQNGLTPINRDVLSISTILASTKLTQNEGLLRLLKWKFEPDLLQSSLSAFNRAVTSKEFAKFMPDVLDALFNILMENGDNEIIDNLVFKNLVYVILLITDEQHKFTQFVPVLELYINDNFYATLAYNKLLVVLKESVANATIQPKDLTQVMKCLRYIFKFVVKSRQLFSDCNSGKGAEPFEEMLKEVLTELVGLMFRTTEDLHSAQSHCLKHMILAVPDLEKVYSQIDLAKIIIQMIDGLPEKQLEKSKISTIKELVHSPLFQNIECREILLPAMASHLRDLMLSQSYSDLVCETLGDILDEISNLKGNKDKDITEMMLKCLKTVILTAQNNGNLANLANMISLLNEMSPSHYSKCIDTFKITSEENGRENLVHFLKDVMNLFKKLVKKTDFPADWTTMIMLQNNVIMRALCEISHTIRDYFSYGADFELEAWNNFFNCAITFVKQGPLQLEKFSENKKLKILSMYGDMRKTMGSEVKQMWFNLGQNKIHFIPHLIGDFLEMALIPEPDLRKATIPIFFDMIQCEYYSSRFNQEHSRKDSTMSKANFHEFQKALITKLDLLIGSQGYGDDHFLKWFKSIMMTHCKEHTSIRDSGIKYVEKTSQLIELLLEYRTTKISNDSKDNQMSCIVNLLQFYSSEINREDLYVKYLKELAALHEKCQNHAEAGFTILQYAKLLEWSDQKIDHHWTKYRKCNTHRKLKENLYKDVIKHFSSGSMWEKALEICKDLAKQFEEETFDYVELTKLYSEMSTFYDKIVNTDDAGRNPNYFRVGFIGRGFPAFLQNKVFVYRGKGYESVGDFTARILDQFPNAETMKTMNSPSENEKEDAKQLVQINIVDPVMEEREIFHGKIISPQILKYYEVNQVNRFTYSRPFHKGQRDRNNEFATLWVERTVIETRDSFPGILQWSPVLDPPQVFELTPLDNAIETMLTTNESVRKLIQKYTKTGTDPDIRMLTMKLNGIIDAAVMGGTVNYEKAFFTEKYIEEHPEDEDKISQLKNLIAEQIPLLKTGLQIHDAKKPSELQPLHERMEAMFNKAKKEVEEKYGSRPSEFNVELKIENKRSGGMFETEFNANLSLNTEYDSDNRTSFNSQNSLDATPLSKAKNYGLNMIGIHRRRSNASNLTRNDETRGSLNSHHKLNSTLESCPDESTLSTTIIVTDSRMSVHNSRPPSGHHFNYLTTSTPNHSRSPSMQSNRDSLISHDDEEKPILPPRTVVRNNQENLETLSLSNLSNNSGSREDIVNQNRIKKKAPPPPPPIYVDNGSETPPTPPRKPNVRDP